VSEDRSRQTTQLLQGWAHGDERSPNGPDQTLESTALVHDAYLRLLGGQPVGAAEAGTFHHLRLPAVAPKFCWTLPASVGRPNVKGDAGLLSNLWMLLPVNGDAELLALNHALHELPRIDERQERSWK